MASEQDHPKTKNGYLDTEPDIMFNNYEGMMRFMQQELHPSPEPKEIKMVVLDADDTMWEIDPWGIASLATPVGHSDTNEVPIRLDAEAVLGGVPSFWEEIAPTGVAKLDPTLRDTLQKLKERGIPVSIASQNDKRRIEKYLDAFGLKDQIVDLEAAFNESKGQMVKNIAQRQKVDGRKILFVDDSPGHCYDVERSTDATCLLLGHNIQSLDELLEFIK
jgi:HAD superfamily phosphatase (TIGR01681 family)